MHCNRSNSGCGSMEGISAQLTGGSRSGSGYSSMQGIYAQLTEGVYLPFIYMHCTRSSSGCSSIQGICVRLTEGFICLLYICIVLDLAVGIAVCKASVLD